MCRLRHPAGTASCAGACAQGRTGGAPEAEREPLPVQSRSASGGRYADSFTPMPAVEPGSEQNPYRASLIRSPEGCALGRAQEGDCVSAAEVTGVRCAMYAINAFQEETVGGREQAYGTTCDHFFADVPPRTKEIRTGVHTQP